VGSEGTAPRYYYLH